jgi:hypothetical protein
MDGAASRSEGITDDRITLNLVIPQAGVKRVTVHRVAPVSSLKAFCPALDLMFLCNGEILSPDKPMGFYDLREQDAIVGWPRNAKTAATNRWMALSRDADAFKEAVHFASSRNLIPESRRLNDLRNSQFELRPKQFLRRCDNVRPIAASKVPVSPSVMSDPADTASTEPLPVWW